SQSPLAAPRADCEIHANVSNATLWSRQHREDRVNLVRRGRQQTVVTRLPLRGSFQDELRHMCFEPRRCLIGRDPRHHLVKHRPHDLDELWTVAWHDVRSRMCAPVAGSPFLPLSAKHKSASGYESEFTGFFRRPATIVSRQVWRSKCGVVANHSTT